MASGGQPKRTNGIVVHVTEHYGFIELKNKNIPISNVHFDRSSIQGARENDLLQNFPKGTHVSLTFVRQSSRHDGKYHAVNLMKDDRVEQNFKEGIAADAQKFLSAKQDNRSGQNPHFMRRRSKNYEEHSYHDTELHPRFEQGPQRLHPGPGASGQNYRHHKTSHNMNSRGLNSYGGKESSNSLSGQYPHLMQLEFTNMNVSSEQKPRHNNHRRKQHGREHHHSGSSYPHEQVMQEDLPQNCQDQIDEPSVSSQTSGRFGDILKNAIATGLAHLANKIGNVSTNPSEMQTENYGQQKSTDQNENVSINNGTDQDQGLLFLREYLSNNGAILLNNIIPKIKGQPNCPAFLQSSTVADIVDVARQFPDVFTFKCGFFCLVILEYAIVDRFYEIFDGLDQGVPIDLIKDCIPPGGTNGSYLYGTGDYVLGVQDFIARNSDHFIFWNSAIWKPDILADMKIVQRIFESDCKAVKYYSPFVEKKSAVSISSLRGHIRQAPLEVREAVKSNNESFTEFVNRNSFFFNLTGDCVTLCGDHRFCVSWLKQSPFNDTERKKKKRTKKGKNNEKSKDGCDNKTEEAKAFYDDNVAGSSIKTPYTCTEDSTGFPEHLSTGQTTSRVETMFASQQVQPESAPEDKPTKKKVGFNIYKHSEAKIFRNIVGKELSEAIKNMLIKQNQKSLNTLILVRLIIDKKPSIRIYNETYETSNHTLMELNKSEFEELQKILRHKDILKSLNPLHYGIKGTLHSLRAIEQDGRLTGLTIFCQIHERNDGLGLEILQCKALTAVVSNIGQYPQKLLYNYLRTKAQESSKNSDVLIMDVDGQLTGCGECPHSSVGEVTRILCSPSELTGRINEAIEHMHECIIVIGVESVETLQSLQKMCNKGAQVIAEISPHVKSEVQKMFGV